MKGAWPSRAYVDLLAGSGRCQLANGEEFAGSPVLSLDAPFTHRVFVERDPALASALRARVGDGSIVIAGDCNSAEVVEEIRSVVPPNALTLAFADNLGLDVRFSTLRRLTAGRKIDLIIVMQLQDLTRNVDDVLSGKDDRARIDAFFGGPEWEQVATEAQSRNAQPREIADILVGFYSTRLGSIGYDYVAESTKVMKNSMNAAQYRLVLAGKHEKAVEFFRKIERIGPYGERHLF
jgi:three-Cys-motif partner protein